MKKPMCPDSPALKLAADESVILAWWQLRDAAEDKDKLGGLPARALGLLLTPAYRKAARLRPEFDRTVKGCPGGVGRLRAGKLPLHGPGGGYLRPAAAKRRSCG